MSLASRQNARRTEMMWMAMNSLFRTKTLASRDELEQEVMQFPFSLTRQADRVGRHLRAGLHPSGGALHGSGSVVHILAMRRSETQEQAWAVDARPSEDLLNGPCGPHIPDHGQRRSELSG